MKRTPWLLLAVACSSDPAVTALRVRVAYDAAWSLDGFDLHVRDRTRQVPPSDQVLLLVPDAWAGVPATLDVWGTARGDRIAHGQSIVVPIRAATVDAAVTLVRLGPAAACAPGATRCNGDRVQTCRAGGDGGTLAWADDDPCPAERPLCSHGACVATCVDDCALNEKRCGGPRAVSTCGDGHTDGCYHWLAPVECPVHQSCSAGRCVHGCNDECMAGTHRCMAGGAQTCADHDGDSCLDWGLPETCPTGQACTAGRCAPVCMDECTADTCVGGVFHRCGQFDLDPCRDLSPGTPCASTDPCMAGTCDPVAGCTVLPTACAAPPPPSCIGPSLLRVYDATGVCTAGACRYGFQLVPCPQCPICDACGAMTCDTPPSPCFAARGTCAGGWAPPDGSGATGPGGCHYAPLDGVACDDGNACTTNDVCTGGACMGTAMACASPPPCSASPGTCRAGACVYPPADGASCDDGNACTSNDACAGGTCAGRPVACDSPPPPRCAGGVLRTFSSPGTCSGGTCQYAHSDARCPSGCNSAGTDCASAVAPTDAGG